MSDLDFPLCVCGSSLKASFQKQNRFCLQLNLNIMCVHLILGQTISLRSGVLGLPGMRGPFRGLDSAMPISVMP